jgi:hypothetical protein
MLIPTPTSHNFAAKLAGTKSSSKEFVVGWIIKNVVISFKKKFGTWNSDTSQAIYPKRHKREGSHKNVLDHSRERHEENNNACYYDVSVSGTSGEDFISHIHIKEYDV